MENQILCMGSINIDLVMYMDKMPEPGETIVTDNYQTFPGGKGGNQASAASLLGGKVKYFTRLGSDNFSQELTAKQEKNGVSMKNVIYMNNATAGVAMIRVDKKGQNSISFTPGANQLLTPKDVEQNAHIFDNCKFLLITMEIKPETVYKAIEIASKKGLTVILDPSPVPENGIPGEIAELVDYTKPNEMETEALTDIHITGRKSASDALKILKNKGFKNPIITLSDAGALTYLNGNEYFIEPIKVQSIDSTAAGDIFLGAFSAALSNGRPYKYCLNFAKTAAAISTTKKGAQSSIPTIEEINAYMKK